MTQETLTAKGGLRPIGEICRHLETLANEARDAGVAKGRGTPLWVISSRPYFSALAGTTLTIHDQYMADSVHGLVLYLLSNLSGFRGAASQSIKQELRTHLSLFKGA